MNRLRIRSRVMSSHDACTSGSSEVLTVASMQRLKLEALFPAPVDCQVRSVIKFLKPQSMAPIEIHRQHCQVYDHRRFDGQHISCKSSTGRCLIINHSKVRISCPVTVRFSYTSRNSSPVSVSVFRMTERRRWVLQRFQSYGWLLGHRNTKVGPSMTNDSIPELNMLKNSSKLPVSVSISLRVTLGFLSANGPKETNFVDALCRL